MDYRQLGRSGLRVSSLTLGTMTFGGGGKFANVGSTDVDGAQRQIDMCLDAGVNLIDTADVYSDGASEEILGQALGGRRDDVLVATKARMPMGDGPNDAGLSRHHLIRACEASLRRLGTDYIDLYQVHEWDGVTPLEETLGALDDLVRAGKVRYIGCSNYSGWQLIEGARRLRARSGSSATSASRSTTRCRPATPSTRSCRRASTRASASSSGARSPAACCRASTAAGSRAPEGARHLTDWNEPPVRDEEQTLRRDRGAVEIGEAHGVSAAQVALAWLLGRPGVTLARDRRAHRGAAGRQPRGRRPGAVGARSAPGSTSVSAPPLIYPALAPGQDGGRPARRRPTAPGWRPT